jgi:hypothetical protein
MVFSSFIAFCKEKGHQCFLWWLTKERLIGGEETSNQQRAMMENVNEVHVRMVLLKINTFSDARV